MLDPATLAAVRERIERKRVPVDVGTGTPRIAAHNEAIDDCLRIVADFMPKEPAMATAENMDTRAAPALTADDVRRIAREEAAKAMADRPEPNSPTMTPNSTQPNTWPAAVEPPAQPAAAKRVEAFLNVYEGNAVPDHWRAWPTRDQAESGRSATRHHVRVAYVREWPGVHDAASAERMMAAMRGANDLLMAMQNPAVCTTLVTLAEATDALAPFLPPVPR